MEISGRHILLLLVTTLSLTLVSGQGKVNFIEEPKVGAMISKFLAYNLNNSTIPGYKIQIINTTDRREMDNARYRFSNLFASMPISWKHVAPNYIVRVGAYRTKSELFNDIQEIRKYFPMSTPVVDVIEKKDLIKYD
jgi:hypothetical protein